MHKILFRADSSSTIGIGHIMRDLVLAKQYPNSQIIFATQDLVGNINHKIIEAEYQLEILNTNSPEELDRLIKKIQIDMLVIDHYEIDCGFEKELKIQNPKLTILSFDDTYEKHYCDILLNHNISANEQRYEDLVPEGCELRCGVKHTLLREEFYQEKEIKREKIYDIFIAMGGADTQNLNIQLLELLPDYFKVAIVTTIANNNLDALKAYIGDNELIHLYINSIQIAKLMNESRFAIVTPSVTVNEIYFMELPFLAIKTAKNQEDIYEYLRKSGYKVVDSFQKNKIEKIAIELINFIDLSFDEKVEVLSWRNHPSIRKWMFDKEPIDLENHISYIESLKEKNDRVYFVVKQYGQAVGVIDLTNINLNSLEAEIGLYAKPMLKGVGSLLMQKILEYGFNELKLKKLVAKVLEDNFSAIQLYEKFDFKQVDKQDSLIVMEKIDENR